MSKNKITVEISTAQSLEKVWDYWTLPQHIVNWNFASDDWHCPKASNDLKTGGKFSFTMASRDGKFSFDFEGTYDEVIDKSKIAYTMADGRQATILFESTVGVTRVTESFDPENTHSEEMQQSGWQSILNNFKKYVEGN